MGENIDVNAINVLKTQLIVSKFLHLYLMEECGLVYRESLNRAIEFFDKKTFPNKIVPMIPVMSENDEVLQDYKIKGFMEFCDIQGISITEEEAKEYLKKLSFDHINEVVSLFDSKEEKPKTH